MSRFVDLSSMRDVLILDGWLSPDTYARHFAEIPSSPAVYLLMMADRATLTQAIVAYVGMSQNLAQRLSGHPVINEIESDTRSVFRWFKPTKAKNLRSVEARYIHRFDPPWNVIGRPRGVKFHG